MLYAVESAALQRFLLPKTLAKLEDAESGFIPKFILNADVATVRAMLHKRDQVAVSARQRLLERMEGGCTVLHAAAYRGCLEIMRLLLSDPTVRSLVDVRDDSNGATALYHAVRSSQSPDVVAELAAAGADVDLDLRYVHKREQLPPNEREFPLFCAAKQGNVDIVTALLQAGANVDRGMDEFGATAFFAACQFNQPDVARTLLRARASVNLSTVWGCSPLVMAASLGHVRMVELCLDAGADIDAEGGPRVRSVQLVRARVCVCEMVSPASQRRPLIAAAG